jgi:accessory gene regulator protein AgrB
MFEMLSLFVGYFLYESDANNWWFTAYWIIVGVHIVKELMEIRRVKDANHN